MAIPGIISGRNSGRGFTLVEAIVAAAIAAVATVVLIMILNLTNAEVKQGTVKSKLQMDYDNVLTAIGDNARASAYVLGPGETQGGVLSTLDLNVWEIHDSLLNQQIAAYRITMGNKLQQYENGQWTDYRAGANPVYVDSANSSFFLTKGRKSVTLNLKIIQTSSSDSDSLKTLGGRFTCRN